MNRTALIATAILALAVTFAAGVITGTRIPRTEVRRQVRVHAGGQDIFAGVDLTQAQTDSIAAITDRYRARTDSLLRAAMPDLDAVLDSLQAELRGVLTPAQRGGQ